jgi:hypothetical protein
MGAPVTDRWILAPHRAVYVSAPRRPELARPVDPRTKAVVRPDFALVSISNHNQSYLSPISNPSKNLRLKDLNML